MAFTACQKYLIVASVAQEGVLLICDRNSGQIIENGTVDLGEESVIKIVVNPHTTPNM